MPLVLAAAGAPGRRAAAAARACGELGADVHGLELDAAGEEPAAPALPAPPVLLWDGDGAFAGAGGASVAAVHAALDGAWLAVRAVAVAHPGGKVLLLAPPPGGPHHEAVRAGLENLARTLGIEWARLGTRSVAILPGPATDPTAVAQVAAYVACRAGDYFSGCAIRLGAA